MLFFFSKHRIPKGNRYRLTLAIQKVPWCSKMKTLIMLFFRCIFLSLISFPRRRSRFHCCPPSQTTLSSLISSNVGKIWVCVVCKDILFLWIVYQNKTKFSRLWFWKFFVVPIHRFIVRFSLFSPFSCTPRCLRKCLATWPWNGSSDYLAVVYVV